jgi:hypothetical protein
VLNREHIRKRWQEVERSHNCFNITSEVDSYKGLAARKRWKNASASAGLYSGTVCPDP